MAMLERRLTILERADPPAVVRLPGEPTDDFIARMDVALRGIYHADPFDRDEHSRAIRPWLAAMTHAELKEMLVAIEAVQESRREGQCKFSTVARTGGAP